jgi:hypothetical protein
MGTKSLKNQSSRPRVMHGAYLTGLWLWIALVLAVYLWQFRYVFDKVYRLLVGA